MSRPPFRRRAVRAGAVLCLLGAAALAPRPAAAQFADPAFPMVLGGVYTSAIHDGTLYLGGQFGHVGPNTGSLACIDPATGAAIPFARVDGTVYAIAPDLVGGFYIGGAFTSVSGVPRANLAYVLADGSLAAWNPGADGTVRALVASGSFVFVGGDFVHAGGAARQHVAAIDHFTGEAIAPWNPGADSLVNALCLGQGVLWVGGRFDHVGGEAHRKIAAIGAGTGAVQPWTTEIPATPGLWPAVSALAIDGPTLYVGGTFASIGGQSRRGLAALDASSGLAGAWDPVGAGYAAIAAIVPNGASVLVGGSFAALGGQPRANLAELSASTGEATAWNPGPDRAVNALRMAGTTLYAGGLFANAGGAARANLAQIDLASGLATAWNPGAHGAVHALGVSPSLPRIAAGGGLLSVGAVPRANLAAIDLATGQLTGWNPGADGWVRSLSIEGGRLYAGGGFASIAGVARDKAAALELATGAATAWNAGVIDGAVECVHAHGHTVYLGGGFTSVKGAPRAHVAALDAVTGDPTAWNPGAANWVNAVLARDGRVFVGGSFQSLGGATRANFGGVDSASGAVLPWIADAGNSVDCIAADDAGHVYAGGWFDTFAGAGRSRVARIDASTGALAGWNPGAAGVVKATVPDGPDVWLGGILTSAGGASAHGAARLDVASGAGAAWDPQLDYMAWTLAVADGIAYAGGDLRKAGALPLSGVAKLFPPDVTPPAPHLLTPAGGETIWVNLEPCVITWETGEDQRAPWVDIEQSLQGPEGPWSPVAMALPNTGSYLWPAPFIIAGPATRATGETPFWLRVTARDLAGHAGSDVNDSPLYLPANGGAEPGPHALRLVVVSAPARPGGRVQLVLPARATVRAAIFDVSGREIARLADGMLEAGTREFALPRALSPGVYFVRAAAGATELVRKFAVLE